MTELTDHERRILAYLDQHGPTHRVDIVRGLASPDSKLGQIRAGKPWGNARHNAACAMIFGRWAKRLLAERLIAEGQHDRGYYRHHEITAVGRRALRIAQELSP